MQTIFVCPICGMTRVRIHSWNKPPIFCSRACANKSPLGPRFKGGKPSPRRKTNGYGVFSKRDGNTRFYISVEGNTMPRARYVWNQAHPDDPAERGDSVHHINGDTTDDRPENLVK